jgi:hypothetical protein
MGFINQLKTGGSHIVDLAVKKAANSHMIPNCR